MEVLRKQCEIFIRSDFSGSVAFVADKENETQNENQTRRSTRVQRDVRVQSSTRFVQKEKFQ